MNGPTSKPRFSTIDILASGKSRYAILAFASAFCPETVMKRSGSCDLKFLMVSESSFQWVGRKKWQMIAVFMVVQLTDGVLNMITKL